jgi:threonine dehydratase
MVQDNSQRSAITTEVVSRESIEAARNRCSKYYFRTPLYHSKTLSLASPSESYLKLECYQPIRVFKIRGALNKMLRLAEQGEEGERPVVTFSAGNHGLAVAYVSQMLGIGATIIVPTTANEAKVRAITEYKNVRLIKAGTTVHELAGYADEISKKDGAVLVHPFADPDVISGQGTIGLEIMEDLPKADLVLVPVGGGGLIGGIATAIKAHREKKKSTITNSETNTRVIAVCSLGAPAAYKSFKERRIVSEAPKTIADGMSASTTEKLNLDLMLKLVDDAVLVSDEEIKQAMKFAINELHILVEPAGAAPLAVVLNKKVPFDEKTKIVSVVSGANANPSLLSELLSR